MISILKKKYKNEIIFNLMKKFSLKNKFTAPKLEKIIISMGIGEAVNDKKVFKRIIEDLKYITGQKPFITKAKKSIASFKLREGIDIGCKITLRGNRMYDFLHRLINIALPRIRDFKGVSNKGFDNYGNYTLGIKEQTIFPEIEYDNIDKVRGLNITFVTTAITTKEAKELLSLFGIPFIKIV